MAHIPIKSYGAHFASPELAGNYRHRPAYASEVFELLAALLPAATRCVLDAGCGPGKLSLGLLAAATRIDAVDPSAAMLEIGRALPGGASDKLHWQLASVEQAELTPPYGLVVAGASMHWMDLDVVLARFAEVLAPEGHFALVNGDAAVDPPWRGEERAIFADFIVRLQGKPPNFAASDREALARPMLSHPRYRPLGATITMPVTVRQSIADYIACQHSRATWSSEYMGAAMTGEFDARLAALHSHHALGDMLEYNVQTRVEWGRIAPP